MNTKLCISNQFIEQLFKLCQQKNQSLALEDIKRIISNEEINLSNKSDDLSSRDLMKDALNTKDEKGNTCLHYALKHRVRNIEIIKILLEKGADPNIQNKKKCTPLHKACRRDPSLELVQLLLNHKADPTIKDNSEFNALHQVCDFFKKNTENYPVIELLFSKVNKHARGKRGESYLSLFCHWLYVGSCEPEQRDSESQHDSENRHDSENQDDSENQYDSESQHDDGIRSQHAGQISEDEGNLPEEARKIIKLFLEAGIHPSPCDDLENSSEEDLDDQEKDIDDGSDFSFLEENLNHSLDDWLNDMHSENDIVYSKNRSKNESESKEEDNEKNEESEKAAENNNNNALTYLCLAQYKDIEIIKKLLEHNASPCQYVDDSATPLYYFIAGRSNLGDHEFDNMGGYCSDIAKLLINSRAHLNPKSHEYGAFTPLQILCKVPKDQKLDYDLIHFMLEKKANVNLKVEPQIKSCLELALKRNDFHLALLFICHNADVTVCHLEKYPHLNATIKRLIETLQASKDEEKIDFIKKIQEHLSQKFITWPDYTQLLSNSNKQRVFSFLCAMHVRKKNNDKQLIIPPKYIRNGIIKEAFPLPSLFTLHAILLKTSIDEINEAISNLLNGDLTDSCKKRKW